MTSSVDKSIYDDIVASRISELVVSSTAATDNDDRDSDVIMADQVVAADMTLPQRVARVALLCRGIHPEELITTSAQLTIAVNILATHLTARTLSLYRGQFLVGKDHHIYQRMLLATSRYASLKSQESLARIQHDYLVRRVLSCLRATEERDIITVGDDQAMRNLSITLAQLAVLLLKAPLGIVIATHNPRTCVELHNVILRVCAAALVNSGHVSSRQIQITPYNNKQDQDQDKSTAATQRLSPEQVSARQAGARIAEMIDENTSLTTFVSAFQRSFEDVRFRYQVLAEPIVTGIINGRNVTVFRTAASLRSIEDQIDRLKQFPRSKNAVIVPRIHAMKLVA